MAEIAQFRDETGMNCGPLLFGYYKFVNLTKIKNKKTVEYYWTVRNRMVLFSSIYQKGNWETYSNILKMGNRKRNIPSLKASRQERHSSKPIGAPHVHGQYSGIWISVVQIGNCLRPNPWYYLPLVCTMSNVPLL